MPIINKIESEKFTILVWKITETLEEIIALGEDINTDNYTSEKRKKEHFASRLLVNEICPTKTIIYNEFGAPELNNGKHISISHSKELVAVIISDTKSGLDIEQIS